MTTTTTTAPAMMTHADMRRWFLQLGITERLPRLGRVLVINQPGGGLWRVEKQSAGFYLVWTVA